MAWSSFATPTAPDPSTFGYRWKDELVTKRDTKDGPLVTLPQYYRLVKEDGKRPQWVVVASDDVPAEAGRADVRFTRPASSDQVTLPDHVSASAPFADGALRVAFRNGVSR